MAGRLLIYGATGFTGRLIADEALAFGLHPILSGRSPHKLGLLASSLGLDHRSADLYNPAAIDAALEGVAVVLNAAGPFRVTALPLARACLARGVHYLDISGEVSSLESLVSLNREALECGVMLMPAAGFDVVPSDCMAALIKRRVPTATELAIGLTGLDNISRGSAQSVFEQYDELVTVRREGRLVRITPGALEQDFDFGQGPRRSAAITWGDVVTAYHSTGIPNITVFYEATAIVRMGLSLSRNLGWLLSTPIWKSWLKTTTRTLPEGPSPAQRARGRAVIVARATDQRGHGAELRLETPEVYSFTAATSIAIADRILHGDLSPGFQTPSRVYGPEFVLSLPGVTCAPGWQ